VSRIRVAYIESSVSSSPAFGGSYLSLLTLLTHLDRHFVEPVVIMQQHGAYEERLEAIDVPVYFPSGAAPAAEDSAPEVLPASVTPKAQRSPLVSRAQNLLSPLRHTLQADLPRAVHLRPLLRELAPHLVHLNNGVTPNRPALLAAMPLGLPVLCHERKIRRYDWIDRLVVRRVSEVVCISDAVADALREQALPTRHLVTVHNAVDVDGLVPEVERELLRERLGLAPSDFVVVLVANFVGWKRHIDLVRAVVKLGSVVPGLRCLLLGGEIGGDSAERRREVEELVASHGLGESVRLLGFRTDVAEVMSAADIMVHPAEHEPFGRVLIEAMACGLPVVATRTGGPREIVEDGETGLLVDVRSPDSLAQAIRTLHVEAALRQAMGERARLRARERFGCESHARSIEKIYRELLGLDAG
jgi:glycosyltransferase involved in cell wall biosynthesis